MLTDTALRRIKPGEKPYKLNDSGGLLLIVNPNGSLWWRLKYRFGGKERGISLEVYPEVTLKRAREKRDEARALRSDGVDPSHRRKADRLSAGIAFERIEMPCRLDRSHESRAAYDSALELAANTAERAYLKRRRDARGAGRVSPGSRRFPLATNGRFARDHTPNLRSRERPWSGSPHQPRKDARARVQPPLLSPPANRHAGLSRMCSSVA